MSATRTLASNISKLKYEDLPPSVVEKGKLAIMDSTGNAIGGYPLGLSKTFLKMAKDVGGGREEATLIGDGTRVSVPLAAFGNGALTTMLDYSLVRGALAVPAALAAGEARGISGRELITSVVAGCEAVMRIIRSMDMTEEQAQRLGINKKLTYANVSLFEAAGAAGRALGLGEDDMLSAMGMAGIYQPVPSGYKWLYDEGLLPRKDIKQGWAWMCMTGAFAAVSAQSGLRMLQENNVLDGERGLWRMLGMDIFKEEELTKGLGPTYHILEYRSKLWPGCYVTHTPMVGATSLVKDHGLALDDIERVEVVTSKTVGVGFHDQEPGGLCDQQFSIPYQVSVALLAGDRGPNWYEDKAANSPEVAEMAGRVTLSFDEEAEQVLRDTGRRMSKVTVHTRSGRCYSNRVDEPGAVQSDAEIRDKFITTTSQVVDRGQADQILATIDNLEAVEKVSELIDLLRIPVTRS